MIHIYIVASTIAFVFLAIIWSTSRWYDILLKMLFVALAFVGAHIAWAIFR